MGKDKKNKNQEPTEIVKGQPSDCGVVFDSSEPTLEAAKQQVKLEHVNKPWTRDAWERAKPFVLEQRQKLEGQGWSNADGARTELFVLRKNAPHGAFTEDGFEVPKKFIDFTRSGKGGEEPAEDGAEGADKKKKTARASKKKENAPSYEINNEYIWKVKVDGDGEESDRDPSVVLDVTEALENILYLLQVLQPGMARLQYNRKDVTQRGTKQSDMRDDGEAPTIRHRAMVAASEKLTRTLPPSFWLKRNAEELKKILGQEGYDATLEASEDVSRSTTREVKGVAEKVWEEKIVKPETEKKSKKKEAAAMKENAQPATAVV
ncbi:hypothetical protein IE53DRAFT_372801 [Violaceomyces palustris]|uniref:Uncharacterized protein n=1 Tax=Violaceomyces palustris TaxID=1673888 RepID=A0ACD0P727_9BASI|nr:hypothetical protein IE53DRAFT_372801 [Violaceomyces palustris]